MEAGFAKFSCQVAVLEDFGGTVEIVYNEHQDQAEFARYNRFSL